MADVVIPVKVKDPDAVLDYPFDWSEWLSPAETILTSVFIVGAGLNLDSSSFTINSATAWLSGGTQGNSYLVTNHITTSQGRTDDRSLTIRVKQR